MPRRYDPVLPKRPIHPERNLVCRGERLSLLTPARDTNSRSLDGQRLGHQRRPIAAGEQDRRIARPEKVDPIENTSIVNTPNSGMAMIWQPEPNIFLCDIYVRFPMQIDAMSRVNGFKTTPRRALLDTGSAFK
jgi:hypothetical protein